MKTSPLLDRIIEVFFAVCLIVTIATAQGCARIKTVPVGIEYCDHAEMIWFDSDEQVDLTPVPIVRKIVNHNDIYESLCKPN